MFHNTSSPHTSYISNTSSQYIFSTIHLLQKVICSISSALPCKILEKFLATKFNFSIKVASIGPGTITKWTLLFLILGALQKWLQIDYFEKHFPVASFGNICTGKKFWWQKLGNILVSKFPLISTGHKICLPKSCIISHVD